MAFNWQTFKTRTLTAAIFVVVMLAGLVINRLTFLILFSVIHFGCWWEYLKLVEKIYKVKIDLIVKYVLAIAGFVIFLLVGFPDNSIYVGWGIFPALNFKWVFYALVVFCITAILFQNRKMHAKPKWLLAAGFIYISLSLGLMVRLDSPGVTIHFHDNAIVMIHAAYFYPASIIASLWVNDTMAYIIGSLIGKTQLSKISPKKTWEGTIAGILLSGIVIFLVAYYILHFGIVSYGLMILAVIASITGTFGDLFESKLKRLAGVKDSGRIMPGHGGFLDRFDSLLVATPFVWLYVFFAMQ